MSSFDCPIIPLVDIQNATNNFAYANLIRRDSFGEEYRGKLVLSSGKLIDILARRLRHRPHRPQEIRTKAFQTEIMMLSALKHQNLISIVGFCDERGEKIIINKFEAKGSLDRYLSDAVRLTWAHRLYICLGIARALSYIHYDKSRDFSVIHRDVKSSKILLGDNWEAKLSGFELSMIQSVTRRHDLVPASTYGTPGYVDPAYIKSKSVSHKSDVYSLGVVLFEVLTGRKASIKEDNEYFPPLAKASIKEDKEWVFLPQLAKSNYDNGKLIEIIHPDLLNQMHQGSLQVFSTEAYCCLNDQPTQRPNIDHVIGELKQALELQLAHENWVKDLRHLKIGLDAINLATENFADKYCIGKGGFGKVFKATELEHFDSSVMEGDKQSRLPIKRSTAAIKTISRRKDKEGEKGFYVEISTLSSCKHANIVSLLGYCDELSNMILVYEHVANGSLDVCLKSEEKMTNLTWVRRLNICIDIARGLDYLHTTTYYKRKIIHTDIKSPNILLGENWNAKISDFGLSRFHPLKDMNSAIITQVDGTSMYLDPEYERTRKLKKESDIYSFGVVLFEILTGKVAYDPIYTKENVRGLAPIVRKHYAGKTLNELVDPRLKEQRDEKNFTLSKGPDQRSLRTFFDIGYQCLAKEQVGRPSMKVIINKLEEALYFQETHEDDLRISFEDIRQATQNFNHKNLIAKGEYGLLYKGGISCVDEPTPIIACRGNMRLHGEKEFVKKLAILFDYKHKNIIGLLGYCNENNERISVFEYASNGFLDSRLNDSILTWKKRLEIAIDVATGLDFLHGGGSTQVSLMHRDIKSANILLDSDWKAKITNFGLSMITEKDNRTVSMDDDACGTPGYVDPQFTRESDIYSLGVVLFEMMCGRASYLHGQEDLVHLVKRHYQQGKLDDLVFEDIKDKIRPKSLTTLKKIAYQCLLNDKEKRPTAKEVLLQLNEALEFQETHMEPHKDSLQISFEDIKLATKNFSEQIGEGVFGSVFRGEISSANGATAVAVKRRDAKSHQGEMEFQREVRILSEYKHKNIVGLLGYCDENNEKILLYEYACNGSLDKHLTDVDLTWTKRLKICIDVAIGLQFLHGGGSTQDAVIHRDIKSANILLTDDWKAKITDFGFSVIAPINSKIGFVVDGACGTFGYTDPQYSKTSFVTRETDIYSLGVVLAELVGGCYLGNQLNRVPSFILDCLSGRVNKLVFEGIKDQIMPKSLTVFLKIALDCLQYDREKRPNASEVVLQLKKALELQEDYEIWAPKLPRDYKEIIQMSKASEKYSDVSNKDLYNMFSKGILLQEGKVCFSLSSNEARNEMVSATMFSYENHRLNKRRSIKKSRFKRVVKMMDISNLKIKIKTKTQFLSPNVIYGAHLVFKFCESRKFSSDLTYVNLKYQMRSEIVHAYFATHEEEEWMMIELCRFIPHKKDVDFEVLIESFSQHYCGFGAIYVEGIYFRAIDDATLPEVYENQGVQRVLKSDSGSGQQVSVDYYEITQLEEGEKLFSLRNENETNGHMLPAKMVLYESSDVKCFKWKSLAVPESRFLEVAEFISNQVFRIKYNIETEKLMPDTDYACYIVFKLSEKCHGLQCPVKVQDLLLRKKEESKFLYFRSPTLVNSHGTRCVPYHREDGLMEVIVWEFNSRNNDHVPMSLKLRCYEGTMSGLIVYGIEIRLI